MAFRDVANVGTTVTAGEAINGLTDCGGLHRLDIHRTALAFAKISEDGGCRPIEFLGVPIPLKGDLNSLPIGGVCYRAKTAHPVGEAIEIRKPVLVVLGTGGAELVGRRKPIAIVHQKDRSGVRGILWGRSFWSGHVRLHVGIGFRAGTGRHECVVFDDDRRVQREAAVRRICGIPADQKATWKRIVTDFTANVSAVGPTFWESLSHRSKVKATDG